MRLFEILLLITGLLLPFFIFYRKGNGTSRLLWLLPLGMLLLHAVVEGLRWQMIPVYLVNLLLAGIVFKGWQFFKGGWARKGLAGLFLFLMLAIGALASSILPVFQLPAPTGSYRVGAKYFELQTNEDEYLSTKEGDQRRLMIKAWYPAEVKDEPLEQYLNEGDRVGFAKKYGLFDQAFTYLDRVPTHTYQEPAPAAGKFPVLIFSHGYFSQATGYYTLLEELASHGYVVFNINHAYESVGTEYPDGEIIFYGAEYEREKHDEAMTGMVWEAMEKYGKGSTREEKYAAVHDPLREYYSAEVNERWTKDVGRVLDQLSGWQQNSILAGHLDVSRIGMLGHSQGGGAAGQALLDYPQIKAGLNLDGTQWGPMVDTFLSKPFLFIYSDWPDSHPDLNAFAYQHGSEADFYVGKLKNSGHASFMDIPYMVRLSFINEAGTIDKDEALHATRQTVLAFFQKHLLNEAADLMKLAEQHPALEIKMHENSNTASTNTD